MSASQMRATRAEQRWQAERQYGSVDAAVEKSPKHFFLVDDCADAADLKSNRDMVLAAVTVDPRNLQYASVSLQNDKEIVLAAVQVDGRAVIYASEDLQNDEEVVLAAVSATALALEHASPDLQNNETIVMAAVQQDGNALQYASSRLQNDETIVLAAVQQPGALCSNMWNGAFQYASSDLQNDETVVLAAARAGLGLREFEEKWRSNEKVVLAALAKPSSAPDTISFVGPDLRKKIMDAKRKYNMSCQEYAAARMKGSVVIHVSSALRSEAALTVACATVGGDEYTVELNPHTENSTAVLRDKIAPKIDVPPAILDILLEEGQLCSPHSDLQICRDGEASVNVACDLCGPSLFI